ncbi:hypothetical protein AB282_01501 [Saccharomyces cerevisiae]|nr:hypothetical protein AB282_01501 [Saccharomyces boulardii (nom. inval.)]
MGRVPDTVGLSRKSKGDLNVRETSGKRHRAVKSNEDAGTAVVATNIESKESFGKKVEDFKEKTVVGRSIQSLKNKLWDESENPLIVVMRKITNKVGGFFAETESSRVYSQFKLMDPTFSNESFTRHLEYIVPEILEAYVKGDVKVLKKWFSEAPFNVYAAQQKIFKEQDVYADGRILDIRGVEIVSAKLLAPKTSQSWWSGVEHKKSTFTGKRKLARLRLVTKLIS